MIKIIQFLIATPSLVTLLKEDKLSLIGVTKLEQQAILEAFTEQVSDSLSWR